VSTTLYSRGWSESVAGGASAMNQMRISRSVLVGLALTASISAALAACSAIIQVQFRISGVGASTDANGWRGQDGLLGRCSVSAAAGGGSSNAIYIPMPGGLYIDSVVGIITVCDGAGAAAILSAVFQLEPA